MNKYDSMKLLGNLAVEKGWLNDKQLKVSLTDQGLSNTQIGEILVNNEFLTQSQLDDLLDIHKSKAFYLDELQFGKIAIENNLVSQEQIDAVIRIQEKQREKTLIGDMLVADGTIKIEQANSILKTQQRLTEKKTQQDKILISCPSCQKKYKIKDPDRYRKVRCKECKFVFEVGAPEVTIDIGVKADGTLKPSIKEDTTFNHDHGRTLDNFLKEHDIKPNAELKGSTTNILTSSIDERYKVGKEIARGGMGAIFATKDLNIRRNIVTKVLHKKNSKPAVMRFIEEAQVNGQLEHPNIVPVHDLGINKDDNVFFTMKRVKGLDFRKLLEAIEKGDQELEAKYPLSARIDILLKICDAISYAHHKRVIHRDLKPENIMVGEFGEVLLMDWGLAKILDRPNDEVESLEDTVSSVRSSDDSMNTIQGSVSGTPQYMAPEQAEGDVDKMDEQTDVYSLGAILHSLVSLKAPFKGSSNVHMVLLKVVKGQREPLPDKTPKELIAIIDKAMAVKKRNRYKTAKELSNDLLNYRHGYSVSAKHDNPIEALLKFVKRNKAVSVGVLIAVLALTIGAGVSFQQLYKFKAEQKARLEEQAKRQEDNKVSAPKILAMAKRAVLTNDFDSALLNVNIAIDYDPELFPAYLLKAQLLIHKRKFKEAIPELETYLKDKKGKDAEELLNLCHEAIKIGLTPEISESYVKLFKKQGVPEFAPKFTSSSKELFKIYVEKFTKAYGHKGNYSTIVQDSDGKIHIYFNQRPIKDLSMLKGIPVNFLSLNQLPLSNLSPIKNLPLISLSIDSDKITDLSPLKNLPLKSLGLNTPAVTDYSPIKNLKLEHLYISKHSLRATPLLKYIPLKSLRLSATYRKDFSDLKTLKLISLNFSRCVLLTDLSPIKNMPLEHLNLSSTRVTDLSALKGMNLHTLILYTTGVSDLTPLKDLPLKILNIWGCHKLKDISLLSEFKQLEKLYLPVHLKDKIEFLRKMPNLKLINFSSNDWGAKSIKQFWKEYDAQKAKQKGKKK